MKAVLTFLLPTWNRPRSCLNCHKLKCHEVPWGTHFFCPNGATAIWVEPRDVFNRGVFWFERYSIIDVYIVYGSGLKSGTFVYVYRYVLLFICSFKYHIETADLVMFSATVFRLSMFWVNNFEPYPRLLHFWDLQELPYLYTCHLPRPHLPVCDERVRQQLSRAEGTFRWMMILMQRNNDKTSVEFSGWNQNSHADRVDTPKMEKWPRGE